MIARKRFPGSPASLDALCRRFGVDNSAREKHGALLDCELLAEVYLELIGGRQPDFVLATAAAQTAANQRDNLAGQEEGAQPLPDTAEGEQRPHRWSTSAEAAPPERRA